MVDNKNLIEQELKLAVEDIRRTIIKDFLNQETKNTYLGKKLIITPLSGSVVYVTNPSFLSEINDVIQ